MDEPRAALPAQGVKQPFRIDARKFIGDEDIFVAVYFAVKRAGFLLGRGKIRHLVARGERHVFPHPFAVHAHLPFPQKARKGERALRVRFVGEVSEALRPLYEELFHAFSSV